MNTSERSFVLILGPTGELVDAAESHVASDLDAEGTRRTLACHRRRRDTAILK
jgi:hypothetical protein